jgi:hypothetical protein
MTACVPLRNGWATPREHGRMAHPSSMCNLEWPWEMGGPPDTVRAQVRVQRTNANLGHRKTTTY